MNKYCFTLVFTALSLLGFSQDFTWNANALPPAYTNVLSITTPSTMPLNTQLMALEDQTDPPNFVGDWHYFYNGAQGTNYTIQFAADQPNLRVAAGSQIQGNASIVYNGLQGSRHLKELYVGHWVNGVQHNYFDIYNEDTIYVEKLYVPDGATLRHFGPAPIVVTKEAHNFGRIESQADNISFYVDRATSRFSLFENKGEFIGRMAYEVIWLRKPEFTNMQWVWDINYTPSIQDSIAAIEPYLTDEQLDLILAWEALGNYDTIVQYLNNELVQETYGFSGYELTGTPLKGTRINPLLGDFNHKASFWDLGASPPPVGGTIAWAGRRLEDVIEPLQTVDALFNNPTFSVAIPFISGFSWNPNPFPVPGDSAVFDTTIFTGSEIFSVYDTFTLDTATYNLVQSTDTVFLTYNDSVQGYVGPSIINILLYDDLLGYSFSLNAWETVDNVYGATAEEGIYQWYDALENLNGWGQVGLWPRSLNTFLTWMNLDDQHINGNRLWESENHYFLQDTTAPNSLAELFSPFTIDSSYTFQDMVDANPDLAGLQDLYPDNYPGFQWTPSSTGIVTDYPRGFAGLDCTTPVPFPVLIWTLIAYSGKYERIWEYRGTPWMNTLDAYAEMPYHPVVPGQDDVIPNLPPNNSGDHEINLTLQGFPNLVYTYAPNGQLFEASEFQLCVDTNTVIYNADTAVTICASFGTGVYPESYYAFNDASGDWEEIYSEEFQDSLISSGGVISLEANASGLDWSPIANPTLGYLDLEKVAEQYFEDYPGAPIFEVAWYSNTSDLESALGDAWNPSIAKQARTFWRKKYFKLANGEVASDFDYWLNRVLEQYLEQGGSGMSPLAVTIAQDLALDGEINSTDTVVLNYLYSGDIKPNNYVNLGQFANPGSAFWVRNGTGNQVKVKFTSDMAVYDFNWPDSASTDVFVGDYQQAGYTNAGRIAQSIENQADNVTDLLCYAYKAADAYFPFLMAQHQFGEEFNDGVEPGEDPYTSDTYVPFVFNDSAAFHATRLALEQCPHNNDPLNIYVPRPNINGAWIIEPLNIQSEDLPANILDMRVGIQLYDSAGVAPNPIVYLDQGDTLGIWDHQYDKWPITGKLYFTDLRGDFNGDGYVGSADLLELINWFNYPAVQASTPEVDMDGNGFIGVGDLLSFILYYDHTIFADDCGFSSIYTNSTPATTEIAFESAPSYLEAGFTYDGTKLSKFGEYIRVYDNEFNLVRQGQNSVSFAGVSGTNTTYLIVTDKTMCQFNLSTETTGSDAYATGAYLFDGTTYSNEQGSSLLQFWDTHLDGGSTQTWTSFYTDIDSYYDNTHSNLSPYINQLYYGFNSENTTGALHSPSNASVKGLRDMFGAGPVGKEVLEVSGGVLDDPHWNQIYNYTTTSDYDTRWVSPPKEIPMAFATPRKGTIAYDKSPLKSRNLDVQPAVLNGTANVFGLYSELSADAQPGATEWGADFKEYYDAPLYHGVIAMVDQLTLRDYFRLKLHGVSNKFGLSALGDVSTHFDDSFGSAYNLSAVNGEAQHNVGKSWAPAKCQNYTEWTDKIVAPFIMGNLNQPVTVVLDPTVIDQSFGVMGNSIEAQHYSWFENSTLYQALGTYGPLCYDFNWNGLWDTQDLDIWNAITAVWEADGDIVSEEAYEPAMYYRSGTDALNTIVNAIPNINVLEDNYQPSLYFESYFDKDASPYIDTRVANWNECLHYTEYINNKVPGAQALVDAFRSAQDPLTLAIFQNGKINPALLSNPTRNGVGAVEYADYGQFTMPYKFHPTASYFPVSNLRLP